ncbi:rhodopsin-like [Penaeus chinensis]|uniref:rhodopsin-like n=1 Tax=Penaeus chinensis TaxID=139456 RepID=UPI001FB7AE7D|nr:rhodopsin-like [Penaeus chinensis]
MDVVEQSSTFGDNALPSPILMATTLWWYGARIYVSPHGGLSLVPIPSHEPSLYGLLGFWMDHHGTLAVAGKLFVIWVFMNTNSLNSPANLLVVNLAISDFFLMLTMTPPLLVNAYWGTWGVSVPSSVRSYAFLGSPFRLRVPSVPWSSSLADRYNVIVKEVSA